MFGLETCGKPSPWTNKGSLRKDPKHNVKTVPTPNNGGINESCANQHPVDGCLWWIFSLGLEQNFYKCLTQPTEGSNDPFVDKWYVNSPTVNAPAFVHRLTTI